MPSSPAHQMPYKLPRALSGTKRGFHSASLYVYREAFPAWDILRQYAMDVAGARKSQSKSICVAMMVLADLMRVPHEDLPPIVRDSLERAEAALGITF